MALTPPDAGGKIIHSGSLSCSPALSGAEVLTMSALTLRRMTPADLPFAASLTLAENWHSETLEEFEGFSSHAPAGCLIAEQDGRAVAIGAATPYRDADFPGQIVVAAEAHGQAGAIAGYVMARRRDDKLWIGPWSTATQATAPEALLEALTQPGAEVQVMRASSRRVRGRSTPSTGWGSSNPRHRHGAWYGVPMARPGTGWKCWQMAPQPRGKTGCRCRRTGGSLTDAPGQGLIRT